MKSPFCRARHITGRLEFTRCTVRFDYSFGSDRQASCNCGDGGASIGKEVDESAAVLYVSSGDGGPAIADFSARLFPSGKTPVTFQRWWDRYRFIMRIIVLDTPGRNID